MLSDICIYAWVRFGYQGQSD